MKPKEFSKVFKEVQKGNFENLTEEFAYNLTTAQAKKLDDEIFNHEIPKSLDPILDILVSIIQLEEKEEKKVANKKAPAPQNEEKKQKGKNNTGQKKSSLQGNKQAENKASKAIKVGQVVKFRVEGEETEHPVTVIYISKYDIILISANEREVFKVRKVDFNKGIFNWKDRHNEEYNIIVSL